MRIIFLTLLSLISFSAIAKADFVMPSGAPSVMVTEYNRVVTLINDYKEQLTALESGSEEYIRIAETLTDLSSRQQDLEDIASSSDYDFNTDLLSDEVKAEYEKILEEIAKRKIDLLDANSPTNIVNIGKELSLLEGAKSQLFINNGDGYIPFDVNTIDAQTSSSVEPRWLFTKFISTLQDHTYTFVVNRVYSDLAAETDSLFKIFVGFWLLWTIINVFFLAQPVNFLNIFIQLILIAIASTMLSETGKDLFVEYFYDPVVGSFYYLSNFFMERATSGLGLNHLEGLRFDAALLELEKLFQATFDISGFLMDNMKSGVLDIGGILKGCFFSLVFITSVACLIFLFCAYWSYAIFALHVLLALTPIMIVLGVFKKTRVYFFKWLSGVINYLSIPVILSISMGITIFILNDYYTTLIESTAQKIAKGNKISTEDSDNIMNIILICFLSFLLHLRVGEISAFLTNGISNGLSSTWALGMMAAQNTVNFARQSPQMMGQALGNARSAAQGLGRATDGAASAMNNILNKTPR